MSTISNLVSGFGAFSASLESATPAFAIGGQNGASEPLTIRINPRDVGVNPNGKMPPTIKITGEQLEKIVFKHYGLDPDNATDRHTLNERLGTTKTQNPFDGVKTGDTITLRLDKKQYVFSGSIDTSLKQAIQGAAQTKNTVSPQTGDNQNGQPIAGRNGVDEAAQRRAEMLRKMPYIPGLPPTGDMQRASDAIQRFQKVMEGIGEYVKENPPTPEMMTEMVDKLQTVLDLLGIIDPTPIADGISATISASRGQFGYAAISMIAAVLPYAGDLAKLGKLPKILKGSEEMVELAIKAPKITEESLEILSKFSKELKEIPLEDVPKATKDMLSGVTKKIDDFVEVEKALKEFSNGSALKEGGWLGKEIKAGDKLPEGYHWREGSIQRNPNAKSVDNVAPLEVREGKLQLLKKTDRLSVQSTMERNFDARLAVELKAKNPAMSADEIAKAVNTARDKVQIHHIIPDELVKNTDLGKAAQKAGYNLDEGENLIGLKNKANFDPTKDNVGHWSSHKDYTRAVEREINRVTTNLEKQYKSLDNVPPDILKKEMKAIEDKFRKQIESGNVPKTRDGRLSFTPTNPALMRGRYEIRV